MTVPVTFDPFDPVLAREPDLGTPAAEDAEKAVLGAVLMRDDAFEAAHDLLRPEHFHRPAHRYIFEAMTGLHERGEPAGDAGLLLEELRRINRYADVPAGLLFDLPNGVPKSANVPRYAERILEKFEQRRFKDWAWRVYCAAAKEQARGDVLYAEAERRLREATAGNVKDEVPGGVELAARMVTHVQDILTHGPRRGLSTGFYDIDAATTGLRPGELVVIAGRPSMGKSSLAGAIAWNVATHGGVVFFESLEMTTDDVTMRLACLDARVNFQAVREGTIGQAEINALLKSASKLEKAQIFIDDQARSVVDVRRLCRKLKASAGRLDLVLIDYLTLMRPAPSASGRRSADSRVREVGEMTAELKLMAKEMRVPVVVLAQLNRGPDARDDKRPRLSDLRESGEIEQDADLVAFMYLDYKYHPDAPQNVGEFIIAKQRNGPTLRIELSWDGPTMRYGNLAR
jgi:replicative DNA helicase